MNILTRGDSMEELEIYLKSGQTLKVKCKEWSFTYDNYSREFTGYTFKGLKFPKMISLVPSQIAGYIVIKGK